MDPVFSDRESFIFPENQILLSLKLACSSFQDFYDQKLLTTTGHLVIEKYLYEQIFFKFYCCNEEYALRLD